MGNHAAPRPGGPVSKSLAGPRKVPSGHLDGRDPGVLSLEHSPLFPGLAAAEPSQQQPGQGWGAGSGLLWATPSCSFRCQAVGSHREHRLCPALRGGPRGPPPALAGSETRSALGARLRHHPFPLVWPGLPRSQGPKLAPWCSGAEAYDPQSLWQTASQKQPGAASFPGATPSRRPLPTQPP